LQLPGIGSTSRLTKEVAMKSYTSIGRTAAVVALVVGATACAHENAPQQSAALPPAPQQAGAPAQQPRAVQQPGAMVGSITTTSATVQKIDKANRQVTLMGPEGRIFDAKAGPDVNLDRLHVGDPVKATYFEAVAVAIQSAAAGAPKMTATTVQRAGVTASQATVTARILSVDPARNSIVIRGPLGGESTLTVEDPALQARLRQIKPGEDFDVTYMQAVALTIEPRSE
jgi:hypothetical protein